MTVHAPNRAASSTSRAWRMLSPSIWALGCGSLLMDTSSELIHSVLPLFMSVELGSSMLTIGILEGVAEAIAMVTRVFSGALSDYVGRRKVPLLCGYALAAASKPVFPLATSITWVFFARCVDRLGKGIRAAPRDALVADLTPAHLRGAAYGLRQGLDSVGAFLGPLLAFALLAWFVGDLRSVMWVAVGPAGAAVAVLALFVVEPEQRLREPRNPLPFRDAARLPRRYWAVVLLGAVFGLARFSEAFLVLRAQAAGMPLAQVPLVMVVMNVVYATVAYPAGAAADRFNQRTLLVAGLLVLIASDVTLAATAGPLPALAGTALWGLHMAMTQGLLAKLVADTAPGDLRGTAFGIFNLVTGAALLLASLTAGALWSTWGAAAPFLAGAGFAGLAAAGTLAYGKAFAGR